MIEAETKTFSSTDKRAVISLNKLDLLQKYNVHCREIFTERRRDQISKIKNQTDVKQKPNLEGKQSKNQDLDETDGDEMNESQHNFSLNGDECQNGTEEP